MLTVCFKQACHIFRNLVFTALIKGNLLRAMLTFSGASCSLSYSYSKSHLEAAQQNLSICCGHRAAALEQEELRVFLKGWSMVKRREFLLKR